MRKTIEDAKNLFESITCLRAEGVEFFSREKILDSIAKEAIKGYNICKEALQQPDSADQKTQCPRCGLREEMGHKCLHCTYHFVC